jgi:hypothetical protein
MTSPQPRLPVERSLARTTLGADLASAAALAVAAVVFRGPGGRRRRRRQRPPVGRRLYRPVTLAARGGLSDATKSAGTLVGPWLVGVSFDPGAGHLLMWVGVVAGGCVVTTHVALARGHPLTRFAAARRPAVRRDTDTPSRARVTRMLHNASDASPLRALVHWCAGAVRLAGGAQPRRATAEPTPEPATETQFAPTSGPMRIQWSRSSPPGWRSHRTW